MTLLSQTQHERLRAEAEASAHASGCELVDLEVKGPGSAARVALTIDRAGGVSVEDCARVSRALAAALEGSDLLPGPFVLEVSSPGLTRELSSPADFDRFQGRLVLLQTRET